MPPKKASFVPLRAVIKKGSRAAELYKKAAGLHPDALAPGLTPSPEQDLKFRGGKTIQDLNFINFYVPGRALGTPTKSRRLILPCRLPCPTPISTM